MQNCISCGAVVKARQKYCDDCRDTLSPWRVDTSNLHKACRLLGINSPVVVRRSPGKNMIGRYHGFNANGEHAITVSARLSPSLASQTIWHELTHAKQREADPNFHRNYSSTVRTKGYLTNAYEREAKANEDYHNTKFSLTLTNKRANLARTNNSLVVHAVDGDVYYSMKYYKYMRANAFAIDEAKASLGR